MCNDSLGSEAKREMVAQQKHKFQIVKSLMSRELNALLRTDMDLIITES